MTSTCGPSTTTWKTGYAAAEPRTDPVAPAERCPQVKKKDAARETLDRLPVPRYSDLLDHLRT